MRRLHQWAMRTRGLFGRREAGRQLDEELSYHLERETAENAARGMPPDEARYAAMRAFGNTAALRDQTRATWSWNWLESLLYDTRHSLRSLLRTPGFLFLAVAVMALGIGGNVALFTVVRGVLLRPLPYHDPDRLFTVYEAEAQAKNRDPHMPVAFGSFSVWQQATRHAAEMAAVSPFQDANVSAEGGRLPEKIGTAWCSANFFSVLGVTPSIGRGFLAEDDRPGAPATALLSSTFWMRRYNGDPRIVGKSIWLDARPYTVIGVLPSSFTFTSAFGGNNVMVWLPVRHEAPPSLLTTFEDHEFLVIARLRQGSSFPALMAELKTVQKQIQATHPRPSVHDSAIGRSMLDDAVDSYKTPLYALLVATGCVLLIACMNVAGLQVAREAARSKELAIRFALGGGRLRLMAERLIESLLLSALGGVSGLLLAWTALQWLVHAREDMARVDAIRFDGVVAMFTVGIILVCALFAGLTAAMSVSDTRVQSALQEGSRAHSGGTSRAGLRRSLLALEVSLTVVLLVGAGLLLKSYQRLRSSDIGVPVENVLTMHISLPEARYKDANAPVAFFEQILAQIRALPGVEAAGLASVVPGEGWGGDHVMNVVEHPPLAMKDMTDILVRGADPGYFQAIRLPILRGRTFQSDERLEKAHVALISQSAARLLFHSEDPIGKHLRTSTEDTAYEIIGVVGDTRWNINVPAQATLYWPIYGNDYTVATIVVRSAHNVGSLALPVEKLVGKLDPDLPVSDVMTLEEAVGRSTINSAFDSVLVMGFAAIALLLAAAGLYGVLAYLVSQRTNEIGIRIALGARRGSVLRLMLVSGLEPAGVGLVLGLAASVAVVRQIASMLYETKPLDPWVFAAVTATLLAVAALACLVPAWRASRLNPMQALRTE